MTNWIQLTSCHLHTNNEAPCKTPPISVSVPNSPLENVANQLFRQSSLTQTASFFEKKTWGKLLQNHLTIPISALQHHSEPKKNWAMNKKTACLGYNWVDTTQLNWKHQQSHGFFPFPNHQFVLSSGGLNGDPFEQISASGSCSTLKALIKTKPQGADDFFSKENHCPPNETNRSGWIGTIPVLVGGLQKNQTTIFWKQP